ncbi:hydroxymethylglutaryl-CoA synthase [Vagococcus sp. PNs007]|uniref:Hydroxymethylglutaryl-CoA synthase n=1 Tax=Vagococcus proximus TaxID=2991417 RepID=A0ABT5WZP2_9ENTE|nr:hydroxymethylglutaryl-CoA synthase [Vagococcus proximus]MDF0479235.1 hydroxymethylglutaryl-CoA synthase [Vagococcus proximus]
MTIGIDKLNFFAPHLYVDLVDLATARGVEPAKYTIGIGQEKMAFPPLTQDTISMGANAALPIVSKEDAELIDLVILGTESGIDYSKAGATVIHQLLGVQPFARAIEIKQACYGATAGLLMAKDYIQSHPGRKALVIASDIARYGLATGGEVTQGAGAVAMLVSDNPKILALEDESVVYTDNIFDFWRPVYSDNALVDGKFSNEAYITFFSTVWEEYKRRTNRCLEDFEALCFHLPYSKMGKKALLPVLENDGATDSVKEKLLTNYEHSILHTKAIGNIYTGSLYLGLCSLLDNQPNLKDNQLIGLFSYGSGAVGEFFTGRLVPGFSDHLQTEAHHNLLNERQALTIPEYEAVFKEKLPQDGSEMKLDTQADPASICIEKITDHQRYYYKK